MQYPAPGDPALARHTMEHLAARDHQALINYRTLDPRIGLAMPTPEHYFPRLYAVAPHEAGEPFRFFNDMVMGSLSMTSVLSGAAS